MLEELATATVTDMPMTTDLEAGSVTMTLHVTRCAHKQKYDMRRTTDLDAGIEMLTLEVRPHAHKQKDDMMWTTYSDAGIDMLMMEVRPHALILQDVMTWIEMLTLEVKLLMTEAVTGSMNMTEAATTAVAGSSTWTNTEVRAVSSILHLARDQVAPPAAAAQNPGSITCHRGQCFETRLNSHTDCPT